MNCRVCGSELPEGAMFCGECGSSVTAARLTRPAVADSRPSDTSIIEPLPAPATAGPAIVSREILFDMPPEPIDATDEPVDGAYEVDEVDAADEAGEPVAEPVAVPVAGPVEALAEALDEVTGPTTQFALSFSSGERARITGGGLLGRRPIAQPGEHVAQIVQISDPGRSVSKTHLEFGIEAGELWICDRYSGNGTVIHPPAGETRLCEPGRRYRVGRGTRVEIGDQFFDVS
ncbi:FHA domain-containing protein [Microbacterium sp. STN6]|uniref:zinc-ribbon domain-containing protein n=1 Tax=Microbacterium sp. STN6 TaxID=2995588 RepID=UPI0022609A87|nr:zinc-ribbon domain-containing protein [Microbacterium sp. STN6]MCX7521194.1 FHA domain-containing protein [Microbacterium sp. STN6]